MNADWPAISRRRVLRWAALTGAAVGPGRLLAQPAPGVWETLADMPFAIQEIYPATVVYKDRPHIVNSGGLALRLGDPVHDETVIYDPGADRWFEGVALPAARHHVALVWDGKLLHALGGFTRRGLGLWEMRREHWLIDDPVDGRWREAQTLPGPRAEAITVYREGFIHMIGGRVPAGDANTDWDDHTDTGLHWAFEVATGRWEERAPLPGPRNSSAGAVLDGFIYVVSGRTVAAGNTPRCHRYDPVRDRWTAIADLPEARQQTAPRGQAGLAGAVLAGRLCVFGGEWFSDEGEGVYADAWAYDPATERWEPLTAMERPRHGLGAVTIGDAIYLIGGARRRGGSGVTGWLDRFRFADSATP